MGTTASEHFERILERCQGFFDEIIQVTRQENPARSRLEIIAVYGSYLIRILEIIFPQGKRKYAYYVIHSSEVVVGFDNAPDPQALKLRYGKLYKRHRYEMIPHCHTQGKAALHLTEPMDVERFLAWIEENLPR